MRALNTILTAFMLFAATAVLAGDLEDGLAAYRAGDYQKALGLWGPLAKQGYASVQHRLGWIYDVGKGVPEDSAKAVYWYRKAANQGYTASQTHLGSMYF